MPYAQPKVSRARGGSGDIPLSPTSPLRRRIPGGTGPLGRQVGPLRRQLGALRAVPSMSRGPWHQASTRSLSAPQRTKRDSVATVYRGMSPQDPKPLPRPMAADRAQIPREAMTSWHVRRRTLRARLDNLLLPPRRPGKICLTANRWWSNTQSVLRFTKKKKPCVKSDVVFGISHVFQDLVAHRSPE